MKNKFAILTMVILIMVITACGSANSTPETNTQADMDQSALSSPAQPTEQVMNQPKILSLNGLKNATYSGILENPVTLKDGFSEIKLEGQPITVEFSGNQVFYGDLDGDEDEDAIVFLIDRAGGTAAFTHIAAQLNQDGQPVDAGSVLVEDRTQILSASINEGQIVLDFTTYGPGDVACCPSHKTRKTYNLDSGKLVEASAENQDLVRISAEDLNGTSWSLLELNYAQQALADSQVTINFEDDLISGSSGCNTFNSSFSLSEDNPFIITIDPVVSTKKACPEPILNQETAFLKTLESISLWGYDFGNLVLFYVDDQGNYSRMLFTPLDAGESTGVVPPGKSVLEPAEIIKDEAGSAFMNGG